MVAESSGFGVVCIENFSFRDDDFDRFDHSFVMRDIRVDHLQEGQDRCRSTGSKGSVDKTIGLSVTFGIVEGHFIVTYRDSDPDSELGS